VVIRRLYHASSVMCPQARKQETAYALVKGLGDKICIRGGAIISSEGEGSLKEKFKRTERVDGGGQTDLEIRFLSLKA